MRSLIPFLNFSIQSKLQIHFNLFAFAMQQMH